MVWSVLFQQNNTYLQGTVQWPSYWAVFFFLLSLQRERNWIPGLLHCECLIFKFFLVLRVTDSPQANKRTDGQISVSLSLYLYQFFLQQDLMGSYHISFRVYIDRSGQFHWEFLYFHKLDADKIPCFGGRPQTSQARSTNEFHLASLIAISLLWYIPCWAW